MPYGVISSFTYEKEKKVTFNSGFDDYQYYVPDNGSLSCSRYGQNTPGIPGLKKVKTPRFSPPRIWKSTLGPKLPKKKVWKPAKWKIVRKPTGKKKKNGKPKYIYSRVYVPGHHILKTQKRLLVQKLVVDPKFYKALKIYKAERAKASKARKLKKFTLPNPLSYNKTTVSYAEDMTHVSWFNPLNIEGSSGSVSGNALFISRSNGNSVMLDGWSPGFITSTVIPDLSAEIKAVRDSSLAKLYEKVKNQRVNLAQMVAERNQTYSLINDGLVKLVKAYVALRKGRLGDAFNALLPSNPRSWMSLPLVIDFGIKPLISDIEGLVESLGKRTEKERILKAVSTSKGRHDVWIQPGQSDSNNFISSSGEVYVEWEISVRTVAHVVIKEEVLQSLSEYGMLNPQSIAWELTPWSFVIDWFIPIGNYLNNLDAFASYHTKAFHRTTIVKRRVRGRRSISPGSKDGFVIVGGGSNSFATEHISVTREVLPVPPDLPYPHFKNPFSLPHITDAVALASQFFSRRK